MGVSRSRRHIEDEVSFTEADLEQVEKVTSQNVSSDRTLTKPDLQLEFAEITMEEPHLMKPPLENTSEGTIGKGRPLKRSRPSAVAIQPSKRER